MEGTKFFAHYLPGVIVVIGEEENGQVGIAQTITDVSGSWGAVSQLLHYNGWFPAAGDSYNWKSLSQAPDQWEAPVRHWSQTDAPIG